MLPGEGDRVRLLTPDAGKDGTGPEYPLIARAGELGLDPGDPALPRAVSA